MSLAAGAGCAEMLMANAGQDLESISIEGFAQALMASGRRGLGWGGVK